MGHSSVNEDIHAQVTGANGTILLFLCTLSLESMRHNALHTVDR